MMIPTQLRRVPIGRRFALTSKGEFATTMVKFIGWVNRESTTDPGQLIKLMVFINEHGYRDEMVAGTPVWIFEPGDQEI